MDGEKFINASLYQNAVSFQRLGKSHYKSIWEQKRLSNPDEKLRTFNILSDPEYGTFVKYINAAMISSAKDGKVAGSKKKERSILEPEYIAQALKLNLEDPVSLQCSFILMLMLMTGVRSGDEMRDLHWGMFSKRVNRAGDVLYWIWDPNTSSEKNHDGGIRDFRHHRPSCHIEYFKDGRPVYANPGTLFQKYHDATWLDKSRVEKCSFPKTFDKKEK